MQKTRANPRFGFNSKTNLLASELCRRIHYEVSSEGMSGWETGQKCWDF